MSDDPIIGRIEREVGIPGLTDLLGVGIPAPDLTSVLLHVARLRAAGTTPGEVLARYHSDRFTRPSPIGLHELRRAEDRLLSAVGDGFEPVMLAPLVPFGTHAALGGTPQDNVVSTMRRTEVAADPTAGLALEAAVRRRALQEEDPRSAEPVRLVTVQRATRAQRFDGPRSFAHFSLVGLVTAGRDTGGRRFERQAVAEHAVAGARGCLAAGADEVEVAVTDFAGTMGDVVDETLDRIAGVPTVGAFVDPERTHARGYYPGVCFKLHVRFGDERFEVGDGGLVDWGSALLGNAKERMMISGFSVDRLALVGG